MKSKTIQFRVNEEELERIKKAAGEKEISGYIREILFGGAVVQKDDLHEFLASNFSAIAVAIEEGFDELKAAIPKGTPLPSYSGNTKVGGTKVEFVTPQTEEAKWVKFVLPTVVMEREALGMDISTRKDSIKFTCKEGEFTITEEDFRWKYLRPLIKDY